MTKADEHVEEGSFVPDEVPTCMSFVGEEGSAAPDAIGFGEQQRRRFSQLFLEQPSNEEVKQ